MLIQEKGSVTDVKNPETNQIIIHLGNKENKWESNPAKDIIEKYPKALEDFKTYDSVELGGVAFSLVDGEIVVATLVCLEKQKTEDTKVPLIKTILRSCLKQVAVLCIESCTNEIKIQKTDDTVLDNSWEDVESILKEELITGSNGVSGYDFDVIVFEK